jgi:hypothetical protein
MALGQLKGSYHGYAVATAPTPEGPFTVVNTQVSAVLQPLWFLLQSPSRIMP